MTTPEVKMFYSEADLLFPVPNSWGIRTTQQHSGEVGQAPVM